MHTPFLMLLLVDSAINAAKKKKSLAHNNKKQMQHFKMFPDQQRNILEDTRSRQG